MMKNRQPLLFWG